MSTTDRFGTDGFGAEDTFRDWDAAYLLGSLSPADRRDYELHLERCESCAEAVAEIIGLPGLLSKVTADEASALLEDGEAPAPTVPSTLLPRLVHSVRHRRRRRVLVSTLGLVAAAAAIVLIVPLLFPTAVPPAGPATAAVSLSQVAPSPLQASIRLVPQAWGTRVEMNCRYAKLSDGSNYGMGSLADYAMYVTDAAGNSTQIATWMAGPGQNAEPAGTTSLTVKQIAAVDVRSVTTGAVLLRGSP